MNNSHEKIISIDISSNFVKTALVSDDLKIEFSTKQNFKIYNEDIDGFAKRIDMRDLWDKVKITISDVLKKFKAINSKIIAISTCAQRIATVFLDIDGEAVYGGPNTDVRGIDSAYLIDDAFDEEELFEITAHNPSILFSLARLLWFKEEDEENFHRINKILMLDDWLAYKLSGFICTDLTSLAESQLIDIKKKKWSRKILDEFNLDLNLLPPLVESGSQIGHLKSDLINLFEIKNKNIPIFKNGADSQLSLLGMGAVNHGDLGISLGTTAPLHLVQDSPYIDPNMTFWTTYHSIPNKWVIEAHAGNTGALYNWFKKCFLNSFSEDSDNYMNKLLNNSVPGALSTFAYLGPELMNLKNQTSIKRGVFVFPPPIMISESLPTLSDFARSVIENVAFGIYENYTALQKFHITDIYCAGGMSKSKEILKVIADVLGTNLIVPEYRDSSFIGAAMKALIGLGYYKDYNKIIKELFKFETIKNDPYSSDKYKELYLEWKNIKNKIDIL